MSLREARLDLSWAVLFARVGKSGCTGVIMLTSGFSFTTE